MSNTSVSQILKVDNLDWRKKMRLYLNEHQNEIIPMHELWKLFGANMPLHHATRIWLSGHTEIYMTDRPMRWRAFMIYLSAFNLAWSPSRKKVTMNHTVQPIPIACEYCGKMFVPHKNVRCCSRPCGGLNRWKK